MSSSSSHALLLLLLLQVQVSKVHCVWVEADSKVSERRKQRSLQRVATAFDCRFGAAWHSKTCAVFCSALLGRARAVLANRAGRERGKRLFSSCASSSLGIAGQSVGQREEARADAHGI